MAEPYTLLAPIYDVIGMSAFAEQAFPSMLDYAQRTGWLGRQITEIGCGTGEGILTLDDAGYSLTGIDISTEMLEVAKTKSQGIEWEQADIRKLGDTISQQDLIVAIDVMNEMDNLREIQAVFASVYKHLKDERLFIFDMYTIAGLTQRGLSGDEIASNANGVTMFASNEYDYERQAATRNHITFQQVDNGQWSRMDTFRVLRAFPLQAVAALLKREKFSNVVILDTRFEPLDTRAVVDRVVFVATK